MVITEEYLLEMKKNVMEQHRKAIEMVQQSSGAIAMIDAMLERIKTEEN